MQELTTFITNHPMLSTAIALTLFLLFFVEFIRAKRNTFNLTPAQVTRLMNREHAIVIDIRPKEVYKNGHIIDALCMTTKEINDNPQKLDKFRTRPLIFVCPAGIESQKIAAQMLKQGYNAYSLAGGIRAWNDAQMPLIKE